MAISSEVICELIPGEHDDGLHYRLDVHLSGTAFPALSARFYAPYAKSCELESVIDANQLLRPDCDRLAIAIFEHLSGYLGADEVGNLVLWLRWCEPDMRVWIYHNIPSAASLRILTILGKLVDPTSLPAFNRSFTESVISS